MKFSFSTLGCPEWTWEEMVATAKDLGFNGIEIRGIHNELYVPRAEPFIPNNLMASKEWLSKLDLDIPCLTSSSYLFDRSDIEAQLREGRDYIDLASKLDVPYIRVLGDGTPEPGDGIDLSFVAENLTALAQYAEGKNVKVLIETNGILSDSAVILKLINSVNSRNIGVLWDIHHPFRYMNEPVAVTFERLKDVICFVHVKDSVRDSSGIRYKMTGYGDVPVEEAVTLLKKGNYQGYVSLEWVKRWCIDLEEPGVVFSHFISYMRRVSHG